MVQQDIRCTVCTVLNWLQTGLTCKVVYMQSGHMCRLVDMQTSHMCKLAIFPQLVTFASASLLAITAGR